MTDHVMKLRAKGDIILAFGEELAKLRNHPELAWQHVWHDADACIFNEHDEIKEIAFAIYNIAGELRLKSMLPPMGRGPVNSRDIGATTPPARCTEAGTIGGKNHSPQKPVYGLAKPAVCFQSQRRGKAQARGAVAWAQYTHRQVRRLGYFTAARTDIAH